MSRTAILWLRAVLAALLLVAPLLLAGRVAASDVEATEADGVELAAADPARDQLPSLDSILDRYVEAVGGREAFRKLHTRVVHGRMITDLPSRTPPVYAVDSLTIYSKAGGQYLVAYRTPDGGRLEGFDGEIEWSHEAGEIRSAHRRTGRREIWLRDPQNALNFRRHFDKLELAGKEMREWRHVYVVRIDDEPSHDLTFDVETGLLNGMGYHHVLEDYREVDGVLMPFRVVYGRKGGSTTLFIDSVEHNVPVDESLFSPPDTEGS